MENMSTCCPFETPVLDQVLPLVLILEFIFGLMGNFIALSMFIFHKDSWRPSFIYLTHMAVADSIVLLNLPFRMDYYLRGKNWIHGDALCRIVLFLLASSRAAGIFFLTAVTVDRYLKIVHSVNRINRMGLGYALWISFGLWALAISMTVYLRTDQHFYLHNNHTHCESFIICMGSNPVANWHNSLYVIQFVLPSGIVIFCTIHVIWQLKHRTVDTQGKIKRLVHFLFVMVLIFIVCFLPSTVSRVAVWILKLWYNECPYFMEANLAFYTSVCFTYCNSVLNPLVYYFSTPLFSRAFQRIFSKLFRGKPEVNNEDIGSTTVSARLPC